MANNSEGSKPAISLPKGGGAIKGIGETFQPNLFSGTGNFSVPVYASPGRNGFGPQLALQYSTGSGNGPFGLGWELSIPRVTRKTDKGLPTYTEDDVFVMSGAEDLVPYLKPAPDDPNQWERVERILGDFKIRRYRPRTEGLFARIERWTRSDGDVHWRATTKENIISLYGFTRSARITHPERPDEIYEWLLEETFDAKGNHILYEYIQENPTTRLTGIHELNRSYNQAYIRRILYGNTPDHLDPGKKVGPMRIMSDQAAPSADRNLERHYLFELLFDYGDIPPDIAIPHPLPSDREETIPNYWPVREDPFSSFRSGFEIRTLRRCRRVLMLHHFKEGEVDGAPLVKSTDFKYEINPDTKLSFLTAATIAGYRRDPSNAQGYLKREIPPVEFTYSAFQPENQRYQSVTVTGGEFPPRALNAPGFIVLDVFGNGLPDILSDTGAGFHFWENLGLGRLDMRRSQQGDQPIISFAQPNVAMGDMGGDGLADLIVDAPPLSGFYESTPDGRWKEFQRFETVPSFDLSDPNTRLIDLTGDGLSDVLTTRDSHFLWLHCLGEAGYDDPRRIPRKHDLDIFPDVYFGDPAGRVRLADMTGDGLNDIVFVHDGRIEYWPNLGYGRFGRRITMANAPRIGFGFDPGRLFLVDLDGSGCADLVYVDHRQIYFWFNQSGNGWSERHTIPGTPPITDFTSLQFVDFYGTGTAAIMWSYDLGQQPGGSNYKILDFCGGQKPNLLVAMNNNMGATTRVQYAPSTKFYLEDKANGKPWLTSLPFPVQVLEKSEVIDHISRTKLVTTYQYHHGYYDGREREFRGFGRVDQFDTEFFDDFSGAGLHGENVGFDNILTGFHAPPIETRSWFHTGVYFDSDRYLDFRELTEQYRGEYYRGDPEAFALDEHAFLQANGANGLGDTPHEAFRALRGAVLRTEVYARDGSAKSSHPYQVTENRYQVTALQPKDGNHHAVYLSHSLESLSYHYERNPNDPRIGHAMTLEVDAFGNPLKVLAIGYSRRLPDPTLPTQADRDKQARIFITYTENAYTNGIDNPLLDPDNYLTPLPSEARSYELTGFNPASGGKRFSFDEWIVDNFRRLREALEIPYEEDADHTREQKRLIEQVRTRYRRNDLTDLLPLSVLESLALPGESYKLAFTPGLVMKVYGARVEEAILNSGGYVHSEGDANWWIPSGRVFYSPNVTDTPTAELAFARQHFFLPQRARDPFGNTAFTDYDPYDLLTTRTIDPLGNRTSAEQDYRLLQPFRVTDANGNRAEVAFDTLGLVAGTAVMGKVTETKGDSLSGFQPDLSPQQLETFLADPLGNAVELLGQATTRIVYDLDRYRTTGQPAFAAVLARATHASDPLPSGGLKVQVGLGYSDGFGREIQKKIQAEPGPVVEGWPIVSTRWVGTGWTIFNNKGKPIKQYEPFFDDTHVFRFGNEVGVSSMLFYDPVEQVVATLHPNHTWEKVVFDPWRQESWDVNDTAQIPDPRIDPDIGGFFQGLAEIDYLPTWNAQRESGSLGPHEQAAAAKTRIHAATPSVAHADSLGRTFLTIAHNRFERDGAIIDEKYPTRVILDIEGNQREVIDAKDRAVMRYDYDLLGSRIHQASMEAGKRWMLNDVVGQPIYAWDSRDHRFRTTFDPLRRPLETFLREGARPEILIGHTVYGENRPNPEANNLRGKVVQVFDQAGVVTSDEYDFKGNLLRSQRQLLAEFIDPQGTRIPAYKTTVDWSGDIQLDTDIYTSRTRYDALNRPTEQIAPDNSVYRPTFNEANLLEKVDVNLRNMAASTPFVTDIDYNAKGQRTLIDYGNGVRTTYEYDPLTFRLIRLTTTRPAGLNGLAKDLFKNAGTVQDLRYTYDPAGNITRIADDALPALFFSNRQVDPVSLYTYDAVYRLIEAQGCESVGQSALRLGLPQASYRDYPFTGLGAQSFDPKPVQHYTEKYHYDAVGNFEHMIHQAENGAWQRDYRYERGSFIEPGQFSNQLSGTVLHPNGNQPLEENYVHDAHGNMTAMPHQSLMRWDFQDQLQATARQVVNEGTPETTYYVYDAAGQRVRKVTERQNGTRKNERTYLGGFEVFREYDGNGSGVNLERESLHVMDDKQRIALVETRTQGNDGSPSQLVRYQLGNHLGSASLELDNGGQIISYEEYHPYGTTSYQAGRSKAEVSLKRYRYTGKERDEETGFSYHGARYYVPWLGRWTCVDPLFMSAGINTFSYARSNPVNLTDKNGKKPQKPTAQYGDINPHKKQGKAVWNETLRLSEHEHIRARINLWLQTFDPQTSTSPYDKPAYRRSSTITIPKDMADIKTRMDLDLRDRLRAAQQSGVIDTDLVREMDIEADIERTVRARDQAIAARRQAGQSLTDFQNITNENITRAAHYQQGELFEVGKTQRSPIAGATIAEEDGALRSLKQPPEAVSPRTTTEVKPKVVPNVEPPVFAPRSGPVTLDPKPDTKFVVLFLLHDFAEALHITQEHETWRETLTSGPSAPLRSAARLGYEAVEGAKMTPGLLWRAAKALFAPIEPIDMNALMKSRKGVTGRPHVNFPVRIMLM
jgi:RHS repeat-associated protein